MVTHKLHYRYEENEYKGMVYACNWACGVTPRKYSYYWKDVTCKNCLKHMPRPILKKIKELLKND